MKRVMAKTALKTSLVFAPLAISSSLLAAGLPALRVDESKKANESGFLYRVIDGKGQAVSLPKIEIDLNEFANCDGSRDKKCVVFSMANRDTLSPLTTEVERFQVQVQNESGNSEFRFRCGPSAMTPVPLYNAPNFVKCEFQALGSTRVSNAREFRENFGRIRDVLPVTFDVTFKAVGRKKVIMPAATGEISIDLSKVENFLKTAGSSLAYQSNGETLLPRSVAFGLVQTVVGLNPCWVGQSEDSWKGAPSYLKGLTEGKNHNALLFTSYENQQWLCKNFRENPNARVSYRTFLLGVYDRVFTEALGDRGEAGYAIESGYDRRLNIPVVVGQASEEWQDESRFVPTHAHELAAFEILDDN
ncbi:MAG: hypothetical protein M3Q07_25370 [Pseudobdellovibrionaceae bacterium]|nr:hypothetical protein [Pseudobdellovibrionaceae bacterium]